MNHNDPDFLEVTDYNLDDYRAPPRVVENWKKHSEELRQWLPSDEELRRRWWRQMFVCFVQRTLKNRGFEKHPYYQWGPEEYILSRYPWMRELWVEQRLRLTPFIPMIQTLRKRWWMGKRHDIVMRWIGGRHRNIKSRLKLHMIVARMVWCTHSKCWYLRLNLMVAIIMFSILFWFAFL